MSLREALFFERDAVPTMTQGGISMLPVPSSTDRRRITDRAEVTDPIKAADAATDRILRSVKEITNDHGTYGLMGDGTAASPSHPSSSPDPRVEMAVGMLRRCGFEICHRSQRGSVYLRWPERKALLRVADHRLRKPSRGRGISSLTFGPHVRHKSEKAVRRYIAMAVGQYFLETD